MKIKLSSKLIVLILITILIIFISIISTLRNHTYIITKKQVEKYLNNNVNELTEVALMILEKKETEGINFKDIPIISYGINENSEEYVDFLIDAQGFLGGQYWGLNYMPCNKYLGEDTSYIWQESDGNNIIVCKKLRDNWFFYYIDYDGNTYTRQNGRQLGEITNQSKNLNITYKYDDSGIRTEK